MEIKRHALDYEESRAWISVVSDAFRAFLYCVQEENETFSDYTRSLNSAREILQSHLGGPILVTNVMEDMCPADVQIESNDDGGMDILFALDQAKIIDEQLSSHV